MPSQDDFISCVLGCAAPQLPSGSLIFTIQRANYINLVAFWIVALSQQAMKSVAHLLQAPELQLHPRTSNVTGPGGAGDAVEDPFSDEERDTTDDETDAEATSAEEPWCPPVPDTPDDPTEDEIAGAADKLETMMNGSQPQANIFFQPDNLGALPALWLQAKLTISLISIQDKFAKLFMTIAAELWLRGCIETLEAVFQAAPRNFTIRLAEKLAKYLCSLMRRAETLATPDTECLLYAAYWFRPILSVLIGAATESANVNRDRAPSGPVKVVVTNQLHSRPQRRNRPCQWRISPPSMVPCQLG